MADPLKPRRTYQGKELRWVKLAPELHSWLSLLLAQPGMRSITLHPSLFRTYVYLDATSLAVSRELAPRGLEFPWSDRMDGWLREMTTDNSITVTMCEFRFYRSGRLNLSYRELFSGPLLHLWLVWRPHQRIDRKLPRVVPDDSSP